VVAKQEERKHNLQSLHRISVAGFVVRPVTSRRAVCCPHCTDCCATHAQWRLQRQASRHQVLCTHLL
jgi:hypothetical protein